MEHEAGLAVPVLVAFGMLAVATVAYGSFRRSAFPFTVLLVLIGATFRNIAEAVPELHVLATYLLSPDIVFFLLLPALIFESAYNLRARELLKNIVPILVLAIPALLISATLVGVGLAFWAGTPLPLAMVFGALICATDPVAVVALFKQLGAPRRLTVLVEGESLLNDGTALVFFKITLAVALAGTFTSTTVFHGMISFVTVAFGGVLVGLVMAFAVSRLIRRYGGGSLIATSFTLITAYGGFILSEHFLGLSGVMATVASALVLGTLAPTAIEPEARAEVAGFWEFTAYACNCLLFLLLGLSLYVGVFVDYGREIALALALTLGARALVVYTMVPPLSKFLKIERVSFGYQTVMFWGGLKGGLAVALALSLPHDLHGREEIMILTSAVVLFTLLVNAPTIRPIMRFFKLDRPTLYDRLELRDTRRALAVAGEGCLEDLGREGYLTSGVQREAAAIVANKTDIEEDWKVERATSDERRLMSLRRALWLERRAYQELYELGTVPELLAIDLKNEVSDRQDRLEEMESLPDPTILAEEFTPKAATGLFRLEKLLVRILRRADWLEGALARLQRLRLAREIEYLMATSMAYRRVIQELEAHLEDPVSEDIREFYFSLDVGVLSRLDTLNRQFPHFVGPIEKDLSATSAIGAQIVQLEHRYEHGEISDKPFQYLQAELEERLDKINRSRRQLPSLPRAPLLRKVPLFSELADEPLERLAEACKMVYCLPGDVIIQRGETGNCMFILESGQAEVLSEHDHRAAMLEPGDFFGEIALLRDTPRNATIRAHSPCALLRLRRRDVLRVAEHATEMKSQLESAADSRVPVTMMMPAPTDEEIADAKEKKSEAKDDKTK